MNCREARPLLPLFLDGEIDARQLRSVALHSTRCGECERELQQLEHLQDLVVEHLNGQLEDVDLGQIWGGLAPRIQSISVPWWIRAQARWDMIDIRWRRPAPVFAALAAATVLAVILWSANKQVPEQVAHEPSSIDNSANLDVVESHVGSTALLNEPETNTMVLWITDDEPQTADVLGDVP